MLVQNYASITMLAGDTTTELAHAVTLLVNPHLLQRRILAILMQVVNSLNDWSIFRQHAFGPCLTTFVEHAKSCYTQDNFEGCVKSGHTIPPEADPVPYIDMLGMLRTRHSKSLLPCQFLHHIVSSDVADIVTNKCFCPCCDCLNNTRTTTFDTTKLCL